MTCGRSKCSEQPAWLTARLRLPVGSHAFQRGLRGKGEAYPRTTSSGKNPPSFWTWREAMYSLVDELNDTEAFRKQTLQCFKEMAAAGQTAAT